MSNPDLHPENEKPGALAGATGALSNDQRITRKSYPIGARRAMQDHAEDRHKRAARTLGYVLLSDTPDAWNGLSVVLQARLTVEERGKLAFAALRALDPRHREQVMDAAHWGVVA